MFTHDNVTFFHYFKVPKDNLAIVYFIKKKKKYILVDTRIKHFSFLAETV